MGDAREGSTADANEDVRTGQDIQVRRPLELRTAQFDREVRFAVVMYGGVSLAIYINGVAQELLHLVRSTAGGGERSSTERIYRLVSYLLSDSVERASWQEAALELVRQRVAVRNDVNAEDRRNAEARLRGLEEAWRQREASLLGDGKRFQARFVIDVVSGTSAGGINGVFLAKALANDQDLSQLQELWVKEGDIGSLINDSRSARDVPIPFKRPPQSLLNSQRMYYLILEALDGMEKTGAASRSADKKKSPYLEELDLFVTTTDIEGLTVPIRLSDKAVFERRYRNRFRFMFRENAINDFVAENNPFLAFAARCTSSFPFAFEPMTLGDVNGVPRVVQGAGRVDSKTSGWEKFFRDYKDEPGGAAEFQRRAFGDGGYLDNKPFSYATETLQHLNAPLPVDRKLIYIEPSPEHPELEDQKKTKPNRKPNALENTTAALLVLPRYETIREDLERVQERNRQIRRVNKINLVMRGVEHDAVRSRISLLSDEKWAELSIDDMIASRGWTYVPYIRLDIAEVTDQLAKLVVRVLGWDEDSDYVIAVRCIVSIWRDKRYTEKDPKEIGKLPINQYLWKFNMGFPLRRLRFLRRRIDQLFFLDNDPDNEAREILLDLDAVFWDGEVVPKELRDRFRLALLDGKSVVNHCHESLASEARSLRSPRGKNVNPVYGGIVGLGISREDLDRILGVSIPVVRTDGDEQCLADSVRQAQSEEECLNRARQLFIKRPELDAKLDEVAALLSDRIVDVKARVARHLKDSLFSSEPPADAEHAEKLSPEAAAQKCIRHYYTYYDQYDSVLFPLQYGSESGEADEVDIIRISPEDATALIDERRRDKCRKLAGTALGHFGAFLEKRWRQNDILWGRLDGVERILTALLPDAPCVARVLTGEAQAAIVLETIDPSDERQKLGKEERYALLSEVAMRPNSGNSDEAIVSRFLGALKSGAVDPDTRRALDDKIDIEVIRDFYKQTYPQACKPAPEGALRSAARATTVTGQILEAISEEQNRLKKPAAWVTRIGRIFWGVVEVSVPRSIPSLLFIHWLKLLYLFEALLIIGGAIFSYQNAQSMGWKALGITVVVQGATFVIRDVIRGQLTRWVILKKLLILAAVPVLLLGLDILYRVLAPGAPEYISSAIQGGIRSAIVASWQESPLRFIAVLVLALIPLFAVAELLRRATKWIFTRARLLVTFIALSE